jgi:hypothetical protein
VFDGFVRLGRGWLVVWVGWRLLLGWVGLAIGFGLGFLGAVWLALYVGLAIVGLLDLVVRVVGEGVLWLLVVRVRSWGFWLLFCFLGGGEGDGIVWLQVVTMAYSV